MSAGGEAVEALCADAPTRRRHAFTRARTPVAVAMRAVAAHVAASARAAGVAPVARRSVFGRRAIVDPASPLRAVRDEALH